LRSCTSKLTCTSRGYNFLLGAFFRSDLKMPRFHSWLVLSLLCLVRPESLKKDCTDISVTFNSNESQFRMVKHDNIGAIMIQGTESVVAPLVVWNLKSSLGDDFPLQIFYSEESESSIKAQFSLEAHVTLTILPGVSRFLVAFILCFTLSITCSNRVLCNQSRDKS